jgi:hypothetical protein
MLPRSDVCAAAWRLDFQNSVSVSDSRTWRQIAGSTPSDRAACSTDNRVAWHFQAHALKTLSEFMQTASVIAPEALDNRSALFTDPCRRVSAPVCAVVRIRSGSLERDCQVALRRRRVARRSS